MDTICWTPLESNPDVMNNLIESLGVTSDWRFFDVYGFDDDLLQFLPRPVVALILLFPCNEAESPDSQPECDRKQPDETGDLLKESGDPVDNKVYFMAQTIQNACGTIAVIHAVANVKDAITFVNDSALEMFIEKTKSMTPLERAETLLNETVISETLQEIATTGQTEAPDPNIVSDCHFVALAHTDGKLYELDGRKPGPICHGPSSPETFLSDAAKVCKDYLEKSPQSLKFSALALCKDA